MGEVWVRVMRADLADSPVTNPISEFESSWMMSLTVLERDLDKASEGGGLRSSLSTGGIVGIVVAIVAAVCAVV